MGAPADGIAGTIPACAGEPCVGAASQNSSKDYPRVCGGTIDNQPGPLFPDGTIPACAGEPARPRAGAGLVRDYPRVCGGTAATKSMRHRRKGTIPACAGEPRERSAKNGQHMDYPRVCGGTEAFEPESDYLGRVVKLFWPTAPGPVSGRLPGMTPRFWHTASPHPAIP